MSTQKAFFDDPFQDSEEMIHNKARMVTLGFPIEWAAVALSRCGGDLEMAVMYCYRQGAAMDDIVREEKERKQRLILESGLRSPGTSSISDQISPPAHTRPSQYVEEKISTPAAGALEMAVIPTDPEMGNTKQNHAKTPTPATSSASSSTTKPSAPSSSSSKKEEPPVPLSQQIIGFFTSNGFFLFTLWAMWMAMGTIFYSVNNGYDVGQAFYMSVNVGYSIGWGYPADPSHESKIFSVIYVLIGSSAISAALGMFANHIVADRDSWYEDAIQLAEFKKTLETGTTFHKIYAWIEYNWLQLKPLLYFFGFVFGATAWSMHYIKWPFIDGLYFAISSMSTGGLWAIPADAPDWQYGIVGAFAAIGCPLMALAMATAASFFIETEDPEETTKKILSPVTMEEIEMMNKFGLENGDGEVDKAEYIVLCMVRIGAVTPPLVEEIVARFKSLDHSNDGALSYAELMQEHDKDGNVVHH